mmetsp:Transcript_12679/g.22591  ORF Transcript_12679/g.22591 Transcript_12679/m.22591 type:complete len:365 (-) Transcript_12679:3-1097(-)
MSSNQGKVAAAKLVEERVTAVITAEGAISAPVEGKDNSKSIGTHDGHFHCDEAFACGMLQLVEEFRGWPIVRTRNADVLNSCGIVVDVGGTFDPVQKRFDHHQRGFEETFDEEHATKLSSAGLVYKYYGKEILATIAAATGATVNEDLINLLHVKVYDNFVEHIDGIDNGIDPYTGERNYNVSSHLSARVGQLNPAWNEDHSSEMANFGQAVTLTTTEFVQCVAGLYTVWLPAREVVEKAVRSRKEVDPSGELIQLEMPCPWKSHLYNLETEGLAGLEPGQVKYVIYPDSSGNWRIQCVSLDENSFTNRLSLPEKYRGVRDDELSELWGIPGCIFVHAAGFIGGNKTYEGILEMARQSLAQPRA